MRQSNLLNTTTFRLALIYLALFATSAIALLGYVYWNTAGFLARQTDQAVQAEITGLAEQYAQGGLPQLVHTVIQRSRDPGQSLYLLVDARGSVLAGNLDRRPSAPPQADGWLDFDFHRRTMDGAELHAARARAFDLPDGSFLIVGRDVQELRGIENLITSSLAWAIALTVAMGLIGGVIISRNMLARVDEINQTSRNIMRGDLSQRVSVAGSGDELDQLAENLNNMLDQIESLMTGMREVTDNIAHDLRSPLNRLRTRLEMAMMQPGSTDEVRTELERSISDADELLSTFNALLAIARAEAGSLRDNMDEVDLSSLVRDAAELYEPVAEEAGITCSIDVEDGLVLFGNKELLAQAIANLIDNAIKHGGQAERRPEISIAAHRAPGEVRVSVSDNGPGIEEGDRVRVLDRFVRLEASRNTPGSGLGLSLVLAAAHLHGGDLTLEDAEPGLRAVLHLTPPSH
ncbi:MAG: HAMP domain-containing sensor histidine kinase [Parvibaculaceae bacterium]